VDFWWAVSGCGEARSLPPTDLGASAETGRHQTPSCAIRASSTENDSVRLNSERCANDLLNGRDRRVIAPAGSSQAAAIKQELGIGVEGGAGCHGIVSRNDLSTVAKKGPHCDPMLRNVSGSRPTSGSRRRDAQAVSTDAPGKPGAAPTTDPLAFGFCTPQEQQEREEQQR